MSAHATSRRRLGRILATGVVTVAGIGLAPATAAAATSDAPVQAAALPGAASAEPRPAAAARAGQVQSDAAASARRSWESRGRPDRMVIVREHRIDVVTEGRVTGYAPHRRGPVTLADLDRALPADWVTTAGGTVLLGATIVLVRDTVMELGGPGSDVHTLQLAGGASPADVASLHTGGGRLALTGLTVGSLDPGTGQPLAPTAAGRPMIVASTGGHLEATDVTLNDLGAVGTATDGDGDAAVEFHAGATGSLVRTTVQRAGTGIELSRSHGVLLQEVTVSGSEGDGLVLSGDHATTMSGIRAIGNGENGVLVTGDSTDRPITGITTSGNHAYGLAVVAQTGTQVTGVSTSTDTAGGLRISRSHGVTVTDFHAIGQRIGVYAHVSSSNIVLDGVHTNGGSRGVVIEKTSSQVEVRNSTSTGARRTGVSINGSAIALHAVQVRGARSGVRVERGAHDIHLDGLVVKGGHDGIVTAPGTTAVLISGPVIDYVTADGIRTSSPDARITGAQITGGTTGIDLAAAATITNSTINAAEKGVHSRSPQRVYASQLTVDALDVGISSGPASPFLLTDSQVHALESVRGDIRQQGVNDLSLPPLNLLSAIGVPLILLAVLLEELHSARQRRFRNAGTRRHRPPLPRAA